MIDAAVVKGSGCDCCVAALLQADRKIFCEDAAAASSTTGEVLTMEPVNPYAAPREAGEAGPAVPGEERHGQPPNDQVPMTKDV
jgi:hypothetical protein